MLRSRTPREQLYHPASCVGLISNVGRCAVLRTEEFLLPFLSCIVLDSKGIGCDLLAECEARAIWVVFRRSSSC